MKNETMSKQIDKAAEAAGDSLPAYSELPAYSREPEQAAASSSSFMPPPPVPPPDYRQAAYFMPYVPIPTALYGMKSTSSRGVNLCAKVDDTTDKLFFAGYHRGLLSTPALGSSPGVQLHNGIDGKAHVLAAAAEPRSQPVSIHGVCSVLILPPPLMSAVPGTVGSNYTKVFMEMARTPTDPNPVYRISLDVGTAGSESQTAEFAWCRVVDDGAAVNTNGGGDDGFPSFQLVRKLFPPRQEERYATQKGRPPRKYCEFPKTLEEVAAARRAAASLTGDGEVVGALSHSNTLKTFGKLFKVELHGSAAEGLLEDRCKIMIVMTAVKLYYMHTQQGKSSRTNFLGLGGEKKKKTTVLGTGEKGKKREVVAQGGLQASFLAGWD